MLGGHARRFMALRSHAENGYLPTAGLERMILQRTPLFLFG